MAQLLASNVAGTLNVTSTITANATPLTNSETRAVTSLVAVTQSAMAITSNTTLSTDSNLSITLNETGIYAIDGFFMFYGSSNAFGNIKMSLGTAGTCTVNSIYWGAMCDTGTTGVVQAVNANTISLTTTSTAPPPASFVIRSVTAAKPNWVRITGIVTINATGTMIPQWAQQTTSANAINRVANSYWSLTKIG